VVVDSGEQVRKGQVLAELFSAEEKAAYIELQEQFDQNMVALLRDPADENARHSLRDIGSKRNRAKSRLEERRIRAPRDGKVSDVRIRVGQNLAAGDSVLSLVDEDVSPIVVAVLPGSDRPQLGVGMDLRFLLSGYNSEPQIAEIEWVSTEVVGPHEARRYLGEQIADTMRIGGPVILVRARLATATFEEGGQSLVLHDGMHGTAEVQMGRESLLASLIPGSD
jgi:membrane fusion protein (multidrug efflux system)